MTARLGRDALLTREALRARDDRATELMDDPDCDLVRLHRTYRQFAVVNRLVAGWRSTYRTDLRPLLSAHRDTTLLDVGFGGGDVARALVRWARRDGLRLAVTAVDPDPRASAFVARRPAVPGVTHRQAGSADLVAAGERFDVVVSNHLLHHLTPDQLRGLLADSERLATRLVLHSDLRRAALPYLAYGVLTRPLAGHSFLHTDGLISIRRSYRPAELADLLPPGWRAEPRAPYRLVLRYEPGAAA